jgi:hypothetical protein
MFCPKCGQQQPSDAVRFCTRCGLALGAAAELLKGGAAADDAEADGGRVLTPRQRGARKGLLVMAGGLLFGLLAVLLALMEEDLFVFIPVAVLVFTVGVMRLLYALLLEDDMARASTRKPAAEASAARSALEAAPARGTELPPARSVPASVYANASRPDTAQMHATPSVTEGTTRLLEEEKNSSQ